MTSTAGHHRGPGEAVEHQGARRDALLSVLLAMCFPFSVALLPAVGPAIGLTGYGGFLDGVRAVIMAALFFLPFVIGAVLGRRAVRGGLHGVLAVTAWVGLIANVTVIAVSLMFLLGEFTNPH